MTHEVSDEDIAAWIDGSLSPKEAERVAKAVAEDPEMAGKVREIEALNALLRRAYDAPMREEAPPAILAALGRAGPNVTALPRRRLSAWWPVAAAAGVALAIGLGIGTMTGPEAPDAVATGPLDPASTLHAALETAPSGLEGPGGVVVILTMESAEGRPCREFEYPGAGDELTFGLACRAPGGVWDVRILVEAPAGDRAEEGYVPAAGPGQEAMDALISRLGGMVVGPEAEARLLAAGWE